MESRVVILLVGAFALFCAVVPGASAIRCYQCTSRDQRCADPIDPKLVPRECTPDSITELSRHINDLSTQTIVQPILDAFGRAYNTLSSDASVMQCQKLDILVDGKYNYTVRGCAIVIDQVGDHCRHIVELNTPTVKTTFCGVCAAEGCNGSSSLVSSLLFTLALPAALVAFLSSSWTRA